MTWNHRVFYEHNDDPDFATYRFIEVHYLENDKPEGYGEPFMVSDTTKGLEELLDRLQLALKQPVLTDKDFKQRKT